MGKLYLKIYITENETNLAEQKLKSVNYKFIIQKSLLYNAQEDWQKLQ